MAKYKVGDKVRVRSDLVIGKVYNGETKDVHDSFVSDMAKFSGDIVTISDVHRGKYYIEEDDDNWNFVDEMFVGLASDHRKFKIGDKVKLKKGLVVDEYYGGYGNGITFLREMKSYFGKIGTIVRISESGNPVVDFGGEFDPFYYHPSMLEVVELFEDKVIKRGDKVVIRPDLKSWREYGRWAAVPYMTKFAGKAALVTKVEEDGSFNIDIDNENCHWTPEMTTDALKMVPSDDEDKDLVGDCTSYCEDTTEIDAAREEELFKKFISKDKTLEKLAQILCERHKLTYKDIALAMIEATM